MIGKGLQADLKEKKERKESGKGELSHNLRSHSCFKCPRERRLFSPRIGGYSRTSFTAKKCLQSANPRMLLEASERVRQDTQQGFIASKQRIHPIVLLQHTAFPGRTHVHPELRLQIQLFSRKKKTTSQLDTPENDDCATRIEPQRHSSMVSTLFWHQWLPKQRENKCKCINTKHTAIRR